jgi:Catalase
VHSKATGALKAEFRVNESLPKNLAKGVFIPGKVYQAWIRFSNGSGNPAQSDNNDDGRGMAIKLLDVPGEKILENDRNASTQDFIMVNHPVFLTNDPHTYLALVQKAGSSNILTKLTIPFTLGLKGTKLAKETSHGKISNPLQIRYFSAVPYQLGIGSDRRAIKFSVEPVSGTVDAMPDNPGQDYLRDAMRNTLQKGDVTMKFLVQPKTSDAMSLEDSMTEWDEGEAPFHEVATIHIPMQNFDTPEQNRLGENLSFKPLARIARAPAARISQSHAQGCIRAYQSSKARDEFHPKAGALEVAQEALRSGLKPDRKAYLRAVCMEDPLWNVLRELSTAMIWPFARRPASHRFDGNAGCCQSKYPWM